MDTMDLYNRLPVVLQNIAVTAKGFQIQRRRYGKLFEKQYDRFQQQLKWPYERKCGYRDRKIAEMVEYCYKYVPFYKKIFDENGINYQSIKTLDDLKNIPLINKKIVKSNFNELISTEYDRRKMILMHTSGSTGAGFQFYMTPEMDAAHWANGWTWYKSIGIKRSDWNGVFTGQSIVPMNRDKKPYYRIDYARRQIRFDGYHMREEVFKDFLEELNRKRPAWLHGYPSSMVMLAQYMLDEGIQISYTPTAITVSSENMLSEKAKLIEKAFGVYPLQTYGQGERVACFYQWPNHQMYVSENYSAVELIPNGSGQYRVIGTSLYNFGMPFLRYETGDLVTFEENKNGRLILTVDGRLEDIIKLKDGSQIGRLDFIFKDMVHVAAAQIVQKSYELLEIHIVRSSRYADNDERELTHMLNKYFAGRIKWRIVYCSEINRTSNGKLRMVKSEL